MLNQLGVQQKDTSHLHKLSAICTFSFLHATFCFQGFTLKLACLNLYLAVSHSTQSIKKPYVQCMLFYLKIYWRNHLSDCFMTYISSSNSNSYGIPMVIEKCNYQRILHPYFLISTVTGIRCLCFNILQGYKQWNHWILLYLGIIYRYDHTFSRVLTMKWAGSWYLFLLFTPWLNNRCM